jgi:hypothetical protein
MPLRLAALKILQLLRPLSFVGAFRKCVAGSRGIATDMAWSTLRMEVQASFSLQRRCSGRCTVTLFSCAAAALTQRVVEWPPSFE